VNKFKSVAVTDLALLADNRYVVFKFNVVEQRLQEYVSYSDETVIFL